MIRTTAAALCVLVVASLSLAQNPPTTAPATQPGVTLKVVTARVNRYTPDLQKKFRNRYSGDGSPGVQMQLMLTLSGQQMMPITQQAISIDTFVDDTYQNLLGQQREYYGSSSLQLSEDGSTLLFPVHTTKVPADAAQRVFVRGSIAARLGRGEPKLESAQVKLKVGTAFTAGPYKGTVRSLNESGANHLSIGLTLTGGEGALIRNVRVLSTGKAVLQERSEPRQDGYPERTSTFVNLSIPSGNDEVVLEFSYFEKLESVKIPFEAQVDIGHAKAGPLEAGQAVQQPGADRRRPWPPPPQEQVEMAPRRPAFRPTTQPGETPDKPRIEKAAVDLFSLTLGKPSPEEVPAAKWQNPPSSSFRPRGFTMARLLLSVPDAAILTVLAPDVTLKSFGDDKTPKLDAAINASYYSYGGRTNIAMASRDGQQALITLPIDAAITPGATRANIAGSVKATVGRGEKTLTDAVELKAGQKATVGPFEVLVQNVYHNPPQSFDSPSETGVGITVQVKGPIKQLKSLQLGAQHRSHFAGGYGMYGEQTAGESTSIQFQIPQLPEEKQSLTLKYFEQIETVTLPFELSTTLGL